MVGLTGTATKRYHCLYIEVSILLCGSAYVVVCLYVRT